MARKLKPTTYSIEAEHMGKFLDAVEAHGRENVRFWFAPKGFVKHGLRPAWDVQIKGVAMLHDDDHEGEDFVKSCPPDCPPPNGNGGD